MLVLIIIIIVIINELITVAYNQTTARRRSHGTKDETDARWMFTMTE